MRRIDKKEFIYLMPSTSLAGFGHIPEGQDFPDIELGNFQLTQLKVGDRLLYKPGTEDFRRCKVEKIEDALTNCDRADSHTGIKPL
jgi:hypothetical protein